MELREAKPFDSSPTAEAQDGSGGLYVVLRGTPLYSSYCVRLYGPTRKGKQAFKSPARDLKDKAGAYLQGVVATAL